MTARETGGRLLTLVSDYLLTLPSDLKILQEAVSDANLERPARELAAGAIVHTLLPQEGDAPFRYVDDVLLLRAAFREVAARGGEGAAGFRARFAEVYERLDEDVATLDHELGELWQWLSAKVGTFSRLPYKGRKASQYVDDPESESFLYEEGLEFETNYNVTEEQVKNRLRRADQIAELLNRRRADESRKIG